MGFFEGKKSKTERNPPYHRIVSIWKTRILTWDVVDPSQNPGLPNSGQVFEPLSHTAQMNALATGLLPIHGCMSLGFSRCSCCTLEQDAGFQGGCLHMALGDSNTLQSLLLHWVLLPRSQQPDWQETGAGQPVSMGLLQLGSICCGGVCRGYEGASVWG